MRVSYRRHTNWSQPFWKGLDFLFAFSKGILGGDFLIQPSMGSEVTLGKSLYLIIVGNPPSSCWNSNAVYCVSVSHSNGDLHISALLIFFISTVFSKDSKACFSLDSPFGNHSQDFWGPGICLQWNSTFCWWSEGKCMQNWGPDKPGILWLGRASDMGTLPLKEEQSTGKGTV